MKKVKDKKQKTEKILKDSGTRREFKTGCIRDGAVGKGRFDLLQLLSLVKNAKICEGGAVKYSPRNWEKGMPLSVFFDSAIRHIIKFALNWQDEEHLSQAVWNICCLQETKLRIELGLLPEELNDIPSEFWKNIPDVHEKMKGWFGE